MSNILITGVDGFIGSYLAQYFSLTPNKIIGLGRHQKSVEKMDHYVAMELPSNNLIPLLRDFRPDICFHCAGAASVKNSVEFPQQDFTANVAVTFHLMDALRQAAPKCRVVYFSSAAIYGNPQSLPVKESHPLSPISPYGIHKAICEQILTEFYQFYGMCSVIVRVFSAYGPGLKRQLMWDIAQQVLGESPPEKVALSGTGEETRDFVYIDDIVRASEILMNNVGNIPEVYNLASGNSTRIKDIAERLVTILNPSLSIEFDGVTRAGDPLYWQADVSKIMSLGFQLRTSLETGLSVYAKWAKGQLRK